MSNEHVFRCARRPQLRVDVQGGSLFVRGWDGDEVRVSDETSVKVWQKGDKVLIESSSPADIKVYLPRTSDVFIDGTDLAVDMGGINGTGVIDVTTCKIDIEEWQGDIEIDGTSGEVCLSRCNGQVEIDTSDGNVDIIACQGRFVVDTGDGSVNIADSSGSLEADTGDGAVTLSQFRGPVHIDTGSGNVELKGISGRNVSVDCGRGNIEATLPGVSPGRWQLYTGPGNITLHVPENISSRFEFEGPELNVQDLSLERSWQDGGKVTGTLNDGVGNVTVFSSKGRIIAQKVPAAIILSGEPAPEKDEESLKILAMLEKGQISTTEAEKLLDALMGRENADE